MVYSSQMWYLPVSLANEGYREQNVRQPCLAIYPAPALVWRRPTCPDSPYLDTDCTPVHRVLFHTLDLCRRSKDLHIIVDPCQSKERQKTWHPRINCVLRAVDWPYIKEMAQASVRPWREAATLILTARCLNMCSFLWVWDCHPFFRQPPTNAVNFDYRVLMLKVGQLWIL